jgi:dCMP deaminase
MTVIKRTPEWWDRKFLELTANIASFSKDPSTQVGSIIVNSQRRIISTGYNGLPRNIPDSIEILNDRKLKYPVIVHAEDNAFCYAKEYNLDVSGCTIFTWPFMPCIPCGDLIIKNGIKRVVAPVSDNPRWTTHFEELKVTLKKYNIELFLYD